MKDTKDLYTEKISLWLDNELNPSEVVELKAHITGCSTCRQTYEAMQKVDHLLRMAATVMVSPRSGFAQRVETRLTYRRTSKAWQVWLTIGALFFGAFSFVGTGIITQGLTLVNTGYHFLDANTLYYLLDTFVELAANLRVFLSIGSLFLNASLSIMQQPLFWGTVFVAISMMGLWLWGMRILAKQVITPANFVI